MRLVNGTYARGALLVIGATLLACNGDSITQYPSRGGYSNQPGTCSVGPANDAWRNARLTGNREQPVKCPYTVVMPTDIPFTASAYGPKEMTNPNSSGTLGPVYSLISNQIVMSSVSAYWHDDPLVSSNREMTFNQQYFAGSLAPGVGPWTHDSGSVVIDGTVYGSARAYVTLSGSVQSFAGSVLPPSRVIAGQALAFQAKTAVDTNAYSFSWSVDGTGYAGTDDADFVVTLPTAGSHQVTALATTGDGRVQPMTTTVIAELNVGMSGAFSGKPGSQTTLNAVVSAGNGSYSYEWSLNGTVVGTGPSFNYGFGSCADSLHLRVTDSAGNSGYNDAVLRAVDPMCG
ncbi:MAG: hypothetical protein ACYC4J_08155 [Gemmatimonadaceae bacterium]